MRLSLRLVLAAAATLLAYAASASGEGRAPFPVFPSDVAAIERAIAAEQGAVAENTLTGITVPHHLVAADLIARAFRAASRGEYERILIFSPDHFKASHKPFAVTLRDFETKSGTLRNDTDASAALASDSALFETSDLFEHEHGVQGLLPFIAHHFPRAKIVPVAVSIFSKRADWDAAVARLKPLLTPKTLIVQSTDFSHWLTVADALQRDQETLNVLAAADMNALARLHQPQHMDSLGAQYLHMALQAAVHQARPVVIANGNAQDYFADPVAQTTSYIVQVYCAGGQTGPKPCGRPQEGKRLYFAGDALFGRNFMRLLVDEKAGAAVAEAVTAVTGGGPLVVNLEGVVADELPEQLRATAMVMPSRVTFDWLTRLNIAAVSLANNHTQDLGPQPYAEMKSLLERSGIVALGHGEIKDLGPARVLALSDLSNTGEPKTERITQAEIDALPLDNAPGPLVAFVHWGRDGTPEISAREDAVAQMLRRRAASAIIGAHPHVVGGGLEALSGGETLRAFSLGNFIFDQSSARSSGAIVELTFFKHGTFFARQLPLPNLYELARAAGP